MRDLAGSALDAASKQRQLDAPILRLYEITLPTSPASMWRLVNHDRDVIFGTTSAGVPLTYYRFPIALGELRDGRQGDLSSLTVNVCNVTHELMAVIDAYKGLSGQRFVIKEVLASQLLDEAMPVFDGDIVHCEVTQQTAVFSIGSPKLAKEVFPSRRVLTQCGVIQFGDAECGYAIPAGATNVIGGGFDFCPRYLSACRERGDDEVARSLPRMHPRLFDGAPGVRSGNP